MMTSAERAKEIVEEIFLTGGQWNSPDWQHAKRIIALAITCAQNDKLEEAARCAQAIMAKADPGGCSWCAADDINTAILALKLEAAA